MLRTLSLTTVIAFTASLAAHAVPYSSGTTSVVIRPSVYNQATAAGVTFATLGSATITQADPELGLTIALPVTSTTFTLGGSVTGNHTVSHTGSGIELDFQKTKFDFTNFVLNTGSGVVNADVSVDGAVFGLGLEVLDYTAPLGLTSIADLTTVRTVGLSQVDANALQTYLGLAGTLGFPVARLSTTLDTPVPEPTALMLFGLGAGLIAFTRRRAG